MARKNLPKFEDWEAENLNDPEFVAAVEELEPASRWLVFACNQD